MIGQISVAWQRVVEQWGAPVTLLDRTTGQANPVPPQVAAAPDGLLPVFLAAGDAVWRDATGHGLGVKLHRDPKALLGYRAERVSAGTFATVMLSMLEATHQIARSDSLPVHDLPNLAAAVFDRSLTNRCYNKNITAAGPAPR